MSPQDMRAHAETLSERPSAAASQPKTLSMLDVLKVEIAQLPTKPEQVVVPPNELANGRAKNDVQRQLMSKKYQELGQKIDRALASNELTSKDAKEMQETLKEKEAELGKDVAHAYSGTQLAVWGTINKLNAWSERKAKESSALSNVVQGVGGGAGGMAAYSAVSAGIMQLGASAGWGAFGGIVGGGVLAVASAPVANYLEKTLGIPTAITHGCMQAGTIGAALAISPASWPLIAGGAAIGLVTMLVSRIAQKAKEEEAKKLAIA